MRGLHARRGTPQIVAGLALGVAGVALLLPADGRVTADTGTVLEEAAPDLPRTPEPSPASSTTAPAQPSPSTPPPAPTDFAPVRLVVETLDVEAPLVATLVDTDGALVPPDDPAQLGWWRGVRPGEGEGSVVVAGHIDSRRHGQGPLAQVVELLPGDRAVLAGSGGERAEYVVRGVQTFPKESFPAADLFGTDGPERLVLVTCGGTFDRGRGGWDSNVVAVLDPAPPS